MAFDNNEQSNNRNFIIAIVLFMAVMFGYSYFFNERKPEAEETKKTEESRALPLKNEETTRKEISVKDAVSKDSRVSIENSHMTGSIDLNGGIIDEVVLKDYKQTTEKDSESVMLLTPRNTFSEFFYEILYNDKTNNEALSEKTVWVAENFEGNRQKVTLKTQTQNGIIIERTISLDDGYLINITDKIINVSDKNVKISANSNLVRTNPQVNNYAVVHEGLVGNAYEKIEEIKYKDVEGETKLSKSDWFGYADIYWLCSVINKDKDSFVSYSKISGESFKISTNTKNDIDVAPDSVAELNYLLFTGPKDIGILKGYGDQLNLYKFDMAIDFGWFFMITKPLIYFMDVLAKVFSNMGLVVLILTLLFKVLTYPLVKKSFKSVAKMKEMRPKISNLQKLYAHDKMRMNQELMALYKKEQISPMSGCLPMLLQAPIFFCLYKVFFVSIQMRHAPLFGWIQDLSAPDRLYVFNLFGLIDWTPPSFLQIGVWPLIMGLSMFLQQKLTTSSDKNAEKTSEQRMQENMMLILPIMFTYICSSFPVAVVIYWTISNIISMVQQYFTNKSLEREKENR
ncbi:MAG: membrane protein insertase YidC [Holosporales bacterium]|jgi:YidC/Oxa1 family membrane protein insertase|nr:membrane protein insertase YidC [Holosporales bacterium]